MGKARLWYETLGAAQLDWEALQNHFWQQYSKFGNTQEQYSMLGGHFNLMRVLTLLILMYIRSNK